MASGGTRDSRRRRVLNDESRLGSCLSVVGSDDADSAARKPRYGEQAHIENHPQASDFVPRRKRFVFAAALALLGCATGAEALLQVPAEAPTGIPGVAAAQLHDLGQGIIHWTAAVAGIVGFVLCRLIVSLRRHRVDDRRGNYRVWSWAAICCLVWPFCALTGLHHVAGEAAAAAVGSNWLPGGAEWWLAPGVLLSVWIAYRMHAEMKEAPGSLAVLSLALTCYAASAVAASGFLPEAWGVWPAAAVRTLPLCGHALAVASLAGFARYVVLDVQGLVEHAPRRERSSRRRKSAKPQRRREKSDDQPASSPETPSQEAFQARHASPDDSRASKSASKQRSKKSEQRSQEADSAWVGGSDETIDIDDHQPKKLSKAERKRLRKQRQNRRAA